MIVNLDISDKALKKAQEIADKNRRSRKQTFELIIEEALE